MFKLSRRIAILIALATGSLSLVGCLGQEAAQRKAFIEFLQTRIIDKPGLHIPIMSNEDITNFGPYADQYRIMNGFHHQAGVLQSPDFARAVQAATPRSLQELVTRRTILPVLKEGMIKMKIEIDKAETEADAAHKALQQPPDLKIVYDAAYERMVTKPAKIMREVAVMTHDALPALEELAAYLDEHRNAIQFQNNGNTVVTTNAEVQAKLTILMRAAEESANVSAEGKRKLRALEEGK